LPLLLKNKIKSQDCFYSYCKQTFENLKFSWNICEFHQYVDSITSALDSYGQNYPDLELSLLEAYETIEDTQFSMYIMITRFQHSVNPALYQSRTIMNGVENLYKVQVQAGTWNPAIEKQKLQDIAVLNAKIDALTTAMVNKVKSKSDKTPADKAWKKVPPKDGETQTTYEGRVYYWCPNHKMWTMNTPAMCQGLDYRPVSKKNRSTSGSVSALTTDTASVDSVDTKRSAVKVSEALRVYIESTDDNMS
jgi:hypothetical protein